MTCDSPVTNVTMSLKAATSVFTLAVMASASSATVTVAVPRFRRVTVTPGRTSPKVFDSRSKVPLKPSTVNWAFCPACAVWTASAVSSCVTVTVLVAPVALLAISRRKSGADAVPRLTAEAVTPASSALMAVARP